MMISRIPIGFKLRERDWEIIQNFKKNFPKTFCFLRDFPRTFVLEVSVRMEDLEELRREDWKKLGKYELDVSEEGNQANGLSIGFRGEEKIVPRWDGGRFAMNKAGEDQNALSWLENWAREQKKLIDEVIERSR